MTSSAPNYEEMAALHALGQLDAEGTRQLLQAAKSNPEVRRLVEELDETAAQLALDAPEAAPPPDLREDILHALPAPEKVLPFSPWFPYALAACLGGLAIVQGVAILDQRTDLQELRDKLSSTNDALAKLRDSYALTSLRIATLTAKDAYAQDPAYSAAKIVVAYDPAQHHGTVTAQDLPAAPEGHDYQLWVLDPNAPAPLSAGVLVASRTFDTASVSMKNPGFAISLEPRGGSAAPTGPILFAVAPAE